ncbi:hypothetical protein EVAR_62495_1 [Eumeta japonica]|uniref:RNA-directed DNA polymerase from mobile element jockey n=1 Tax=Eumeta variegata TaxID=151549 RepID=A0A4C1SE71_EUMVA|nr:hypothetical protein EVAR_62495_1 [Eumeta japonica]
MIGRKSKMSLLNKRTLYTMCIRPVMTYACPVFAHAARLHSKTFSCGLVRGSSRNHFLRRPRNALSDPPDDLTAEVEELNKALENLME